MFAQVIIHLTYHQFQAWKGGFEIPGEITQGKRIILVVHIDQWQDQGVDGLDRFHILKIRGDQSFIALHLDQNRHREDGRLGQISAGIAQEDGWQADIRWGMDARSFA